MSVMSFANIFFHSVGFLFCQWFPLLCKSLRLSKSHLFIFVFISFALGEKEKHIVMIYVRSVFCLCSRSFMVSGLTFRPLIHFKFIFLYGMRKCSKFILFHEADQFSQQHLLKRLSFLHCIFLSPLS